MLHRLLLTNPRLAERLKLFAEERAEWVRADRIDRGLHKKAQPPASPWDKTRANRGSGDWVKVVGGGLPTLGKRR